MSRNFTRDGLSLHFAAAGDDGSRSTAMQAPVAGAVVMLVVPPGVPHVVLAKAVSVKLQLALLLRASCPR